jgi:hypothetical protein
MILMMMISIPFDTYFDSDDNRARFWVEEASESTTF